jgi:hypothetical protein
VQLVQVLLLLVLVLVLSLMTLGRCFTGCTWLRS